MNIEHQQKTKQKSNCFRLVHWSRFRTCYNANPRPDALMKEQLVEMTGLSPRVIRVWFQNKRCKDKKKTIQMKLQMQQEKVSVHLIGRVPHSKCVFFYIEIFVSIVGWPKIGLWCNARHTDGGQFTGASRFTIKFAWTWSDIISTAVESTDRIRTECRFG